jgi:hypothetical protein
MSRFGFHQEHLSARPEVGQRRTVRWMPGCLVARHVSLFFLPQRCLRVARLYRKEICFVKWESRLLFDNLYLVWYFMMRTSHRYSASNLAQFGQGATGMGANDQSANKVSAGRAADRQHLIRLYDILVDQFSEGELRTLCFHLDVAYDDLPGEGRADRARELLSYLERRHRVPDLLEIGRRLRSDVPWETAPEVAGSPSASQTPVATASHVKQGPALDIGPRVEASGERSIAAGGSINAPILFGNIRDSVVKITTASSPLLRVVLFAVLTIAALTLAGVLLLVLRNEAAVAPPSLPDPGKLKVVGPPDLNLAITALARQDDAGQSVLWFGAQSDDRHALYRLGIGQQAGATPQHVLDVDGRIIDLAVDCRGNVWTLLQDIGTLVYRPQTGQHGTLLNRTTTGDWLVKHTTYAIATRCTDDNTVEVWLGREGVHTLRYGEDYPTMDAIELVPWEEDEVFEATRELGNIRALHYVTESETLWVASSRGQLLAYSFKGVLAPRLSDERDSLWAFSQSPSGEIWVGGSQHLLRVGHQIEAIALVKGDEISPNVGAFTIAAGRRWVWFGGRCANSMIGPPSPSMEALLPSTFEPELTTEPLPRSAPTSSMEDGCQPLWVYVQDHLSPVDLGERKEVTGIIIDSLGTVWIGTDAGLVWYPASEG